MLEYIVAGGAALLLLSKRPGTPGAGGADMPPGSVPAQNIGTGAGNRTFTDGPFAGKTIDLSAFGTGAGTQFGFSTAEQEAQWRQTNTAPSSVDRKSGNIVTDALGWLGSKVAGAQKSVVDFQNSTIKPLQGLIPQAGNVSAALDKTSQALGRVQTKIG
jgi:hypothetical protein